MARARLVHPVAWWLWALGLAFATMRTTNIPLLLVILAVAGFVVSARRTRAVWGNAFRLLLLFGLIGIVFTVALQILIGVRQGGHVVLNLPQWDLPSWTGGLSLGGPVTAESILAAATKGLRLTVLLACFGAANSLAHPGRLLPLVPAALYELGVAVVVALTFVPQMTESLARVHAAQRSRGRRMTGVRAIRTVAVPVLEESLERAISLAASMDSRGYGRRAATSARRRRTVHAMLFCGLAAALVGSYVVIDPTADHATGVLVLIGGTVVALLAVFITGRQVRRSRYRVDPWGLPEWITVGSAAVTVVAYLAGDPSPQALGELVWPSLPVVPFLGTLVAALPGILTPAPVPDRLTASAVPA